MWLYNTVDCEGEIELQNILRIWTALPGGVQNLLDELADGCVAGEVRVVDGGEVEGDRVAFFSGCGHGLYPVVAPAFAVVETREVDVRDLVENAEATFSRSGGQGEYAAWVFRCATMIRRVLPEAAGKPFNPRGFALFVGKVWPPNQRPVAKQPKHLRIIVRRCTSS